MKRQATDWETMYANHISDKRLTSGIDKEILQLNNYEKKS